MYVDRTVRPDGTASPIIDALAPARALTSLFDRWHLDSADAVLFARRGGVDLLPLTRSGIRTGARLAGLHLAESDVDVVHRAVQRLALDCAAAAAPYADEDGRAAARCAVFVNTACRWAAAVSDPARGGVA